MSKEALDPPEPPANPRVVNYDKTYVELQWWAPDKSDIKHYIIEMQETFLVPKDAAMPEEAEGINTTIAYKSRLTQKNGTKNRFLASIWIITLDF